MTIGYLESCSEGRYVASCVYATPRFGFLECTGRFNGAGRRDGADLATLPRDDEGVRGTVPLTIRPTLRLFA